MLQAMHKGYEEFVSQSQIDSLRYLLSSKEEHLYQIMQLFHSQNSQEGMQFSHLPAEAQPRTVIGDSSFRIYNSQDIEQGIAIHAGRTAGKYQCLYR